MEEMKMEFEYRYLSEEKAAEIDANGFTNTIGTKLRANSGESVTDDDETIVFRQIWCSHEESIPSEYLLLYKGYYYFVDIYLTDIKGDIVEDKKYWFYKFDVSRIRNAIYESSVCPVGEIIVLLKSMLYTRHFYGSKTRKQGDEVFVEIMYKGEKYDEI